MESSKNGMYYAQINTTHTNIYSVQIKIDKLNTITARKKNGLTNMNATIIIHNIISNNGSNLRIYLFV